MSFKAPNSSCKALRRRRKGSGVLGREGRCKEFSGIAQSLAVFSQLVQLLVWKRLDLAAALTDAFKSLGQDGDGERVWSALCRGVSTSGRAGRVPGAQRGGDPERQLELPGRQRAVEVVQQGCVGGIAASGGGAEEHQDARIATAGSGQVGADASQEDVPIAGSTEGRCAMLHGGGGVESVRRRGRRACRWRGRSAGAGSRPELGGWLRGRAGRGTCRSSRAARRAGD